MPIVRSSHRFDTAYTQIPNAWIRDPRLSLRAKGLLAQLMSHAPGWRLSLRSLAEANACGLDAIRAAVNELLDAGYLARSETRERNEAGHLGDFTYWTQDPGEPTSENPTLENPTLGNPTPKNNSIKEQQDKEDIPQPAVEAAFAMFWEIYPRRVEKIAARKAFVRAFQEYGEQVLDGARRMAEDPNLPPRQFVPYPASWLNAGGWDSEPYPVREKSADEKAADAAARAERDRVRALEHSRKLREEMAEAERRAFLDPPRRCEHGRIAVVCETCQRS